MSRTIQCRDKVEPMESALYLQLQEIHRRPTPFEHYTAADLWTSEHTSSRMLAFHLDGSVDVSSRKTDFIDRAADWMIKRFGLGVGKSVADFGCGPGLYTSRLAASGATVTGIDFSERSLHYARELSQRQGLSIDYIHADYLSFESDRRFDLITLIMCDYCALSPGQRLILLDRFYTHLKTGGALLLDVYSLMAFEAKTEAAVFAENLLDGFWSPAPYFGFLNTFRYEADHVGLDKYTIVEERGTRVVYNWLQYFDRGTLQAEIESSALVVEEFRGDAAGAVFDPDSHEFAVIARKPPV